MTTPPSGQEGYRPAETMRLVAAGRNILAFYDGRDQRIDCAAATAAGFDGETLGLGIASYAVVSGEEALVYDTHISLAHGARVRDQLAGLGVERIRVVYSHWHHDHVAGAGAFADCEIIANERTRDRLIEHRADLQSGARHPAIDPLVMPTTIFRDRLALTVGAVPVVLVHADIHSDDETLALLPESRQLIAGDCLEDTITYVAEPEGLQRHIAELDRIAELPFDRILPCHGSYEQIAAGGYQRTFIRATQQYVRMLLRMRREPELREMPLKELIQGPLLAGWIEYHAPYEAVHRSNVARVAALAGDGAA
ncbi:MAG: MBL fold metallo-hydrolase [Hyphomicrobiaceae bacterium]